MSELDPYEVRIGGVKADPYRIARAYGITDPVIFQALKKLLRFGRKHKDQSKDVREAITSLERWEAMNAEDAGSVVEAGAKSQIGPTAPLGVMGPVGMPGPRGMNSDGSPGETLEEYAQRCLDAIEHNKRFFERFPRAQGKFNAG